MRKTGGAAFLLIILGCFGIWLTAPKEPLLDDLRFGSLVLDNEGKILRLGLAPDERYRLHVSLDRIAPEAVNAALEYEDRYFHYHPGVNPFSFFRAAASLFSGRRIGGSTLTMQVARMLYGLQTSSITGKLRQIWYALALEVHHSKEEILEAYFNLAPYGGNVEGMEAASRIYFHKSAAQLTDLEARLLALVPQNPVARNPARSDVFRLAQRSAPAMRVHSTGDLPFLAPHLSLELANEHPGVILQTGIESDLQYMLEKAIEQYTGRNRRAGLVNASALLLRFTDMQICALIGSAGFNDTSISGQIDGTRARRSPGSTLKPFIYGLALDQGLIHPLSILPDSPRSFGGYDPDNFDRGFRGPIAAGEALRASRNLPAIYLSEKLAHPDLYTFLKLADINFPQGRDHYGLALALGGAEITMRKLAGLYAMLANQGLWYPLRIAKGVPLPSPSRLLSPEAAWLVLHMLRRPEATVMSGGNEIPWFYKTGTSNGMRDAWTAGIIGDYVLIVWLGNFDNRPNPDLVGARAALPLFQEIVASLARMRRLVPPDEQPGHELNLAKASFCTATGDIYRGQCEAVETGWLIPGISPTKDSGIIRRIEIDPETGLRQCASGTGKTVWHEFWPSDLEQIFLQAGIRKPHPPAWSPECEGSSGVAGAPRILLPKKNVSYQRTLAAGGFRLPLLAAADSEAGEIHWYAGSRYLGSAKPGEIIYWDAPAGKQVIRAVSASGKSASRECRIMALP